MSQTNVPQVRPASEAQALLPCKHAFHPAPFVSCLWIKRRKGLCQTPESLILAYAVIYQETLQRLTAPRGKKNQALMNAVENCVAPLGSPLCAPACFLSINLLK